ncbi:Por secretion system C-terminal sorting domain-containing protein [Mesonia phycicola]|uniref:Por secretion system C-terminal sorting domain-containing protein n=1 Tax=Mesonia phycicola TaxID=579105 RepID=A0A1M6GY19_9FLAO|nr:T9SS type A sorting domain-containing protein [Mesonia phycicola]SHJ14853.1 Por secretion system C-terminal sorting domain-containing protein [Mesonia phycicola]
MKKITLLFTLMIASISFAQTPIITMIADGDCTGGTPKVVEIYADGTVDFSLYSIERQSNGGSWGTTTNLSSLNTVTDDFIYIYYDTNSPEVFASEFPSATNVWEDGVVNFNGDDAIRIVLDSDSSVIDQYGVDAIDGSGQFWEYADGYAKRNTGTTANGSFNQADWTFSNGALDGFGLCQGGNTFESIIGLGSFVPGTVTCPLTVTVTSVVCDTETTGATSDTYTVTGTFSGGGTESYSFSLNAGTITSPDDPSTMATGTITVSGIPEGTDLMYSITSASCSISNTITAPECEPATSVNDIASLRAGTIGGKYTLTSEAILTYQQNYRNQKYIEDATGAILIDDNSGVITTTYAIADGITGITGELASYNGILQFYPETDPGAASSTGNTITPQTVTIADYNTNYADYESEMIMLSGVTFVEGDGTAVFATGTTYNLSNGSDQMAMYTNFWDESYIGSVIPTTASEVTGIAAKYDDGTTVTPQIFATSIEETLSVGNNTKSLFSLYPNPTSTGYVSIETENSASVNVEIFNLLGKKVISANNVNSTLNISTLNTGVYLVKLTQNGVSSTKKLIIK